MHNIIIAGAGYAAIHVARNLANRLDPKKHSLTVVTPRKRHLYNPAALRLLADPSAPIDSLYIPYDHLFAKFPGKVVVDTVTAVVPSQDTAKPGGTVSLAGGDSLEYNVLVFATGCSFPAHLAFPEDEVALKEHIANWRDKVKNANNIVIAGGGPVGIEFAGEIKDVYPDKNITIVQRSPLLLNDIFPDRFRKDIEKRLRAKGITLVLNDSINIDPSAGNPTTTVGGVPLQCDLLIPAPGGRPNTQAFQAITHPVSPLTDRGYLRVLPTLQVQDLPCVFALGDVIDTKESRQLTKVDLGQSATVVENVLACLRGAEMKKKYTGSMELMTVSIGKRGGSTYIDMLGGLMFGDTVTKYLKSNDLQVPLVRKSLGLSGKCTGE